MNIHTSLKFDLNYFYLIFLILFNKNYENIKKLKSIKQKLIKKNLILIKLNKVFGLLYLNHRIVVYFC